MIDVIHIQWLAVFQSKGSSGKEQRGFDKMKIIQIIPRLGMGGAETMCENLSTELMKSGNEVIIISLSNDRTPISKRLEKNGIPVLYLGKKNGLDIKTIIKLRKVLKKEKPDIIHSHTHALKYCVIADLFLHHKKIHTVHSIASKESTKIDQKLNKIFFKVNKVVPVALSELVKKTIIDCYRLDADNIPVVFNGCPIEKCIVKDSYTLGEKVNIIHVGSLIELKNHKAMIDAITLLHKEYPNVCITFVGDGILKSELEKYINERNCSSYIKLHGLSTDVYSLLGNSDIFILPSLYEGLPMSIIEAMGTGLPIVASNVGGIPDMIKHQCNGLLCDPSVNSIYEALLKFIISQEFRETCGISARESSYAFSCQKMCANYVKLYEELI